MVNAYLIVIVFTWMTQAEIRANYEAELAAARARVESQAAQRGTDAAAQAAFTQQQLEAEKKAR